MPCIGNRIAPCHLHHVTPFVAMVWLIWSITIFNLMTYDTLKFDHQFQLFLLCITGKIVLWLFSRGIYFDFGNLLRNKFVRVHVWYFIEIQFHENTVCWNILSVDCFVCICSIKVCRQGRSQEIIIGGTKILTYK